MSVESIARIVVAVVSVVWLVGCAGGETHDDTSRSVERMQAIVEDAREAGVTQAQMAALEASLAQGAMTYETLASLMPDFQECAAGVGAEVQIRPPQDEPGSLLIPDYAVFVDPDDEKAALSEDMRNSGGSAMSACYQGTELAVRRH